MGISDIRKMKKIYTYYCQKYIECIFCEDVLFLVRPLSFSVFIIAFRKCSWLPELAGEERVYDIFDSYWRSTEGQVETKNLVFCSGYNVSTLFFKIYKRGI